MQPTVKISSFIETKKSSQPEVEIREKFLAHLEKHLSKQVYTDGSKRDQYIGLAAVFQDKSESVAFWE